MPQSGVVKYNVKLSYEVDGLVERADIIGPYLDKLRDY